MNEYQKINDCILNITEEAKNASIQRYLDRFKGSPRLDKLENLFLDFQQDTQRASSDCDHAINSPIYVGVVGHYSHGKSSLLNALLFPPKSKEILPTGESIVTAMCTLLGFTNEKQGHKFYKVGRDGREISIPADEYQAEISGRRTGSLGDVHHYRLKLNTDDLNPGVFQAMSEKKIELLDTPGLGGPYWKDQNALQSWIKEFMLLIVAVRCDAINRRTADTVNPFLKYTSRPIIPVVTFWDLWQESEVFKGITSEEDARAKVRDDLSRWFPTMADAVEERTAFVSVKNYRDQVPVPPSEKQYITEDWNIDNARNTLTSYISSKVNVLQSQRSEQSDLEINRKRRVIDGCNILRATFERINSQVTAEIEACRPKAQYEDDLAEAFQKLRDGINNEYERILDRIAIKVEDSVSSMPTSGKWSQALSDIEKDIKQQSQEFIKEALPDRLKQNLDRGVIRTIKRYLENDSPLEAAKAKRVEKRVEEICNDLVKDLTKTSSSPFVAPQGVTDWAKNTFSALWDGLMTLLTTNLPMALLILAAIFILPPVIHYIKDSPWLPDGIGEILSWVKTIIFIAGAFSLFAVSWANVKRAREITALNVKDKARKQNRRADISNRLAPDVEERLKAFEIEISETLSEAVRPLVSAGDDMAEEVQQIFKNIESEIRIITKECGALERGLR